MTFTTKGMDTLETVCAQRREVRLPCTPTVVYAHLDGYDEPVAGEIVEVSKAGVQLHIHEPLPIGSLVTVDFGGMIVLGDVRHCDERIDEYYTIGLRTCDVRKQGPPDLSIPNAR